MAIGIGCGFLFHRSRRERDDLGCCYLEGLALENFWREFSTKNPKFVIRIAFRVYLRHDLTSQNRLSNLILPLGLK